MIAIATDKTGTSPPTDGYLVKVSPTGSLAWERYINLSPQSDGFASAAKDGNGGYFLSGSVWNLSTRNNSPLTAQANAQGQVLWSNIFPCSRDARGVTFGLTPDGGAVLASRASTESGVRPWLVKLRLNASLPCWTVR